MSYGFNMNFIQCKSKADALDKINKISELYYSCIEEVIEDNKYFIPSIKYNITSDKERSLINEYWIKGSLSLRFIYWKKYRLLGILGDFDKYNCIQNLFNASIYFQNSTDQDYDYEYWGNDITLFNKVIKDIKTYTFSKLKEIYNSSILDDYEEEISKKDNEYYLKSVIYQIIYDKLDLNNWLYNYESSEFFEMKVNPINSLERIVDVRRKLHLLLIKLGIIAEDNYYI